MKCNLQSIITYDIQWVPMIFWKCFSSSRIIVLKSASASFYNCTKTVMSPQYKYACVAKWNSHETCDVTTFLFMVLLAVSFPTNILRLDGLMTESDNPFPYLYSSQHFIHFCVASNTHSFTATHLCKVGIPAASWTQVEGTVDGAVDGYFNKNLTCRFCTNNALELLIRISRNICFYHFNIICYQLLKII